MKIEIEVPDYSPENGLRMLWEPGAIITAQNRDKALHITANQSGLLSLARLLLTLTDPQIPSGNHWHLDDLNALEPGSTELIIEKQ